MLAKNKDALICDMAETYGIFDIRSVPLPLLATLAAGLRPSARIKMELAGVKASPESLLIAAAVDRLSLLVWRQTEDGRMDINRPRSLVDSLTGKLEQTESQVEAYDTPEAFEAARERVLKGE